MPETPANQDMEPSISKQLFRLRPLERQPREYEQRIIGARVAPEAVVGHHHADSDEASQAFRRQPAGAAVRTDGGSGTRGAGRHRSGAEERGSWARSRSMAARSTP